MKLVKKEWRNIYNKQNEISKTGNQMINKIFVDSDVLIDVAVNRMPFATDSIALLKLIEHGYLKAYTSSNCIANIHYILRKQYGDKATRQFIRDIIKNVNVIGIQYEDVVKALDSNFKDFEDSLQFHSALRNDCEAIITRNGRDYQHATVDVYSPTDFLNL